MFVILAILTSIAVPTLLGSRNAAENLAAQSGLRDVLFAEKAHFLVNEAYTEDPEAIRAEEPNALLHPSDVTKGVVVVFAPDTMATCASRGLQVPGRSSPCGKSPSMAPTPALKGSGSARPLRRPDSAEPVGSA